MRESAALHCVVLALLCVPGLSCLGGDFIWTDAHEVLEGGMTFDSWAELGDALLHGRSGQYYRPAVFLAHSFTKWGLGGTPLAFRSVNYFIHALNVAATYALVRASGAPRAVGLASASLFAVHPVCALPIAWAADQTDLLALFGALASLACAQVYWRTGKVLAAVFAGLAFMLGVTAKQNGACVLALLAAGLLVPRFRRRAFWTFMPGVAIAGCWFFWADHVAGNPASVSHGLTALERLSLAISIHANYLLQLIVPSLLLACDGVTAPQHHASWLLLAAATLGAGVIAVLRWRRDRRYALLWALLWALAFLVPTSGLIELKHARADRYLYPVLPGLLMLLSLALYRLGRKGFWLASAAIYSFWAIGLVNRASLLENDARLWRHEVAANPSCREGWAYLGVSAFASGDYHSALDHYRRALSTEPREIAFVPSAEVSYNAGLAATSLGDLAAARTYLSDAAHAALAGSRLVGPIAYQRGLISFIGGHCEEALTHFQQVRQVAAPPAIAIDARLLSGVCSQRLGQNGPLLEQLRTELARYDLSNLPEHKRRAFVDIQGPVR